MKNADYENGFEQKLKSNGLEFTAEPQTVETMFNGDLEFRTRVIKLKPKWTYDCGVLVTLQQVVRKNRPTTSRVFAVHNGKVHRGLRNVWLYINAICK
jgi:hypothetical protein